MAISEMGTHKLRSSLSMLGVMLGVASLAAMLTLIGGIDVYLNRRMSKWIGSVWFWQRWDPPEEQRLGWSRSPGMRLSDGAYLEGHSSHVKAVPLSVSRFAKVNLGGKSEDASLRGIDQAALELDLDEVRLARGRWLTEDDFRKGLRNCVISWQLAENLVRNAKLTDTSQVLGRALLFRNTRFLIVGTYEPKSSDHTPWHLRRGITVPIRAMQRYVTGSDPDPGRLQVQVTDPRNVKVEARHAALALMARHRGVEDFEYRTAEWLDRVKTMLNNISLLMSIVSVMSLLVGGLSIMNVMLSSISERIKEIGVRKALGAHRLQIFVQFLAETTTLSFVGGSAGVAIGAIPLFFKKAIMESTQGAIEPTILPIHVLYTFAIIVTVGVLFGLYPALKASRMNPVDALRYE